MRWVLRFLGLLVALLVAAVAAFFLIPAERIAGLVEQRFEAATGRALSIGGDVRPGLWPEIGLRTGPVSIANADWAGPEPMVEAEALSVGIAWKGLFGGDIRVTGVDLTRPVIRLARDADGRGNWEMVLERPDRGAGTSTGVVGRDAASTGNATNLALDRATISDGAVIWSVPGSPPFALLGIDATLSLPDFAGPATLSLEADANGEALTADLAIAEFAAFLSDGAVPVTLEAGVGAGTLAFDGRAGLTPAAAEGRISADLDGPGALLRALGAPPPDLAPGLGRDRLSLDGALTYAGDALSFREASLAMDGNRLSGDADVSFGGTRPRLVARLSAGALDLSGLRENGTDGGGGGAASGGGDGGADGWSTAPIDVSGLRALDAEIALEAASVRLPASEFGRTRLGLALENGRLVATIRELVAYDGEVAGQVVVNGRDGLSASADLSGSAIAISRLFAELLDFDRLVALGDMEIAVRAAGSSMDAMMNAMNGEGSFRFGAGELLGLDLVGMLRNLDPSYVGAGKATIFDEITGTFRIVDGVVINQNLKLLAPFLTATGSGRVALGRQTLDYRIVPKLLSGEGEGLSVPIVVTGSWAAPKFSLDLEGLIDAKAGEEIDAAKKKLERKAKRKLRQKLGGGAGVDPGEAAKDKLEDELTNGLKKLLR